MANESIDVGSKVGARFPIALAAMVLLAGACKTQDRAVTDVDPLVVPSASTTASSLAPSALASAPVASAAVAPTASSSAAAASPPDGGGLSGLKLNSSGGCPCGCDHSEGMAAELRSEPRDVALASIDDSLRTIGDREDAGYITERMIEHRLRLLDLGRELRRTSGVRFTKVPTIRAPIAGKANDVNVLADLLVHGDTVEIIHGREKPLRASFVLRLDVANASAHDVTLHAPTLEGSVALPVSRWYVVGGDGTAWDGVMKAGEKKLVHVIGYVGAPLRPGTHVDATFRFESLTVAANVRARARWDE